jgi:hypothetical protein
MVAKFAGASRVRTREASAWNTMSITQCKQFSMAQCPSTSTYISMADTSSDDMKKRVSDTVVITLPSGK